MERLVQLALMVLLEQTDLMARVARADQREAMDHPERRALLVPMEHPVQELPGLRVRPPRQVSQQQGERQLMPPRQEIRGRHPMLLQRL